MSSTIFNQHFLSIQGLTLHFDEGKTKALNGINLEIAEGEFVAIAGPSGSGKSSLLNVIGILDTPTYGTISFCNQPYSGINDASLFRRKNIGFIFQSFHLIPTLTALDNVIVPTIGCDGSASNYLTRAISLLTQFGLSNRLHQFPGKLSGGERQRVAIARSLINSPSIILADEPTGSLDSVNASQVLNILTDIVKQQKITLIMVTHDANISRQADRIVYMRDGLIEPTVGATV